MASLEALQSSCAEQTREERHAAWRQRRERQQIEQASTQPSRRDLTRNVALSISESSDAATMEGVVQDERISLMVVGTAQRSDQLESKKLFRPSSKINPLMPRGSRGLNSKVPRRKDFGEEGEEGDAAHEAAMSTFSIKEFGSTHVKDGTIDSRMGRVGVFGHWLELNMYGKYVVWHVKETAHGKERCMVALDRNGVPRVPSDAAMMVSVMKDPTMCSVPCDADATRRRAHAPR